MALLIGLLSLRSAHPEGAPEVVAAHFNPRLRGPESEGDARPVPDFCRARALETRRGTGDALCPSRAGWHKINQAVERAWSEGTLADLMGTPAMFGDVPPPARQSNRTA